MDAKKVFNVVYVSSNQGTGEVSTAQPDCSLNYTGSQVSINPVGVTPGRFSGSATPPADIIARFADEMIMLPNGENEEYRGARLFRQAAAKGCG